ncbi:hypothetical protein Zmor_018272 [Zophobas morio]|uniref:Uncharacterized protein n=1 Tax=Zophobas morio TaxID=2755281 RepID=A0AA38IC25_9CUCU|nr:hypothetical protein Zmor_018272 [Zophobas morio]
MGASTPGFTILYYYGQACLQEHMMIHSIQNINANYTKVGYISSTCDEYQQTINKRLLFCLKSHIHVETYSRKALRLAEVYVLPYEIMGTIVTASVVVFCFVFEGSLEDQYLRIAAVGVEVITVLAAFVVSGQRIEDAAERVFDVLREVDWYHWNQINKKIYLIFLTNASRVFKIKYSENISLNHKLGIEVVKAVFSALSLTYSLQHKKYTN